MLGCSPILPFLPMFSPSYHLIWWKSHKFFQSSWNQMMIDLEPHLWTCPRSPPSQMGNTRSTCLATQSLRTRNDSCFWVNGLWSLFQWYTWIQILSCCECRWPSRQTSFYYSSWFVPDLFNFPLVVLCYSLEFSVCIAVESRQGVYSLLVFWCDASLQSLFHRIDSISPSSFCSFSPSCTVLSSPQDSG